MSTETTNKKIKIDNGTTFGRTYTDKAIDAKLPTDLIASANKLSLGVGNSALGNGVNLSGFTYDEATKTLKASGGSGGGEVFDVITPSEDRTTYTGTITGDRPVLINRDSFGEIILTSQTIVKGGLGAGIIIQEATTSGTIEQTEFLNGRINIDEDFIYYHHFITLTKDNDIIYIQYQSTRKGAFSRMSDFISALSGKKVLCTAVIRNSDGTLATPLYVSGEAGVLKIYYVLKNDTGETITSKSIADYTISDKCSPLGL